MNDDHVSDLEIFFRISPDLMCITDFDGRIIRVNPAWETVLGYTAAEVEGQLYTVFVHPDELEENILHVKALLNRDEVKNIVTRYRHRDGSYHTLEWSSQSDGQKIYAVARDVTQKLKVEEYILFLSYRDHLTGLYNRRFLEEEMKRLDTARNLPISIIMGDLNRLKLINDAFGHETGDELILKATEAIKMSCRPDDLIARWGGDEFFIFLPKTSYQDAEKIVERIIGNCSEKQVNSIPVTVSFGIGTKDASHETLHDVMRDAENRMYKNKSDETGRSRNDIIKAVANTLYENNPYEEKHAKRVSALCRKMAEVLGLQAEDFKKLSLAGLMHDIGKIAVSREILQKPSALNDDEKQEIYKHPKVGSQIVGSGQEMAEIGQAILTHHERADGHGYPEGIAWRDVPLAARVIALADSYDSMITPNSYHPQMTRDEAIAELRRNSGTQFDPQLVETFIEKVILAH